MKGYYAALAASRFLVPFALCCAFAYAQCPSILSYGGINNGTGDNSAAFANTIAASPSGNACVFFPAGTYAFTSQVSYTLPFSQASVTIAGSGRGTTTLLWPSGGGLAINYVDSQNSASIHDLSFVSGSQNVGSALTLNQTGGVPNPAGSELSDITNVTIGRNSNYWNTGINILGVSNVNLANVTIWGTGSVQGTGVSLSGSGSAGAAVVFNFTRCGFNYLNNGIVYGNGVQGVTISQSNFTGDNIGIYSPGGLSGLDQLAVSQSQFNDYIGGIIVSSLIPNIQVTGSLFIVPSSAVGIAMNPSGYYSITGNSFNSGGGNPQNGIAIANSFATGVVTGNSIIDMGSIGIWLQSGSTLAVIHNNAFQNNGNNIVDQGSNNSTSVP